MRDSFPFGNLGEGQQQNTHIQRKRAVSQIILIEIDLDRYGKLISAVDLRPAGQSGSQHVHPLFRTQCDQIILVVQGGTRADKTHVSSEDAPELWQLIQAGCAQESADGGQPLVRVTKEMCRNRRGVGAHGAKLGHFEDGIVPADAVGPVENRAGRGQLDSQGNQQHGY